MKQKLKSYLQYFSLNHEVRQSLWISVLIVLLDQISKGWILIYLPPRGISLEVLPIFNLVLSHNYGAGFGLLAGLGGLANLLFILVTLIVLGFLLNQMSRFETRGLICNPVYAMALIIGGALGNGFDRVWRGAVVDFLDFHWGDWHWPAFNIADSAIFIGVMFWLTYEMRQSKEQKPQKQSAQKPSSARKKITKKRTQPAKAKK